MSNHNVTAPGELLSTTKKLYTSIIVSFLVGGVAFILHAAPELAKNGPDKIAPLFFPYAYWIFRWVQEERLLLILIIAQFPCYGVAFAWAWCRDRQAKAVAWIVFLHVLFAFSLALLNRVEHRYLNWPGN